MSERMTIDVKNFITWLYRNNYQIVKILNDHDMRECNQSEIIEEHEKFWNDVDNKFREKMLSQGVLVCSCNCLLTIEKRKRIQCLYCGKVHDIESKGIM